MIIDRLVLHNFGAYKGRHEIALSPPSKEKNVILIGALNGAGKTTLLDAIQLVMHGKLSSCSNRGPGSYDDFLRRSIHRNVDRTEGAALELEFKHRAAGEEHLYRVRRSWNVPSNQTRESLSVWVDGRLDGTLSESWPEYAEAFLPSGIAPLFLFDGEKIERLADPEQSAGILRTAIHSLLGLTIVDQLSADLAVLSRRKQEHLKDDESKQELDNLEQRILEAETLRTQYVEERGSLLNNQTRCERRLLAAETQYRQEGGAAFEQETEIQVQLGAARSQLEHLDERLLAIAADTAPLLLLIDSLTAIETRDREARTIAQAHAVQEVLEERDHSTLALLSAQRAPEKWIGLLRSFLSEDRDKRSKLASAEPAVALSDDASAELRDFLRRGADKQRQEIEELISERENLEGLIIDFERRLASVPQKEAIEKLSFAVDKARTEILEVGNALVRIEVLTTEVNRNLDRLNELRERMLRNSIEGQFTHEDSQRVVLHSTRMRDTLEAFRAALLERNVKKLGSYVLDSYRQLMRKQALVERIEIDPRDFSITLVSPSGDLIRPDRLSAGERQLLATAILWGLARASGHALPMVIDTPLGRLDSTHRTKLVERYFPHASHQVILLSTDEEIDHRYYDKLKRWIGRTYCLEFHEDEDSTRIREGYFAIKVAS
jgi:DNA sulfur modification protein DndD